MEYDSLSPEEKWRIDHKQYEKDAGITPPTTVTEDTTNNIKPIDTTTQANQQVGNLVGGALGGVKSAATGFHDWVTGDKWRDALHTFQKLPQGPERDAAREEFFQKYYGASFDEYQDMNMIEQIGAGWKNADFTSTSLGGAIGVSLLDLPMDIVGLLPGGDRIDEGWDDATAYRHPLLQQVRNLSGIVIPTLLGTGAITKGLTSTNASTKIPWLAKSLTNVGAYGALDAAIIGVSDLGEEDNAAAALVDFFPEIFGAKGAVPLPDFMVTLDSDSPAVRRQKNIYESAGLSIATNILGYWLSAGKPTLKWFRPLDDTASKYKNTEVSLNADNELLIEIQEIDALLNSNKDISEVDQMVLFAQRKELVDKAKSAGTLDEYIKNSELSQISQNNSAARAKLEVNPDIIDIDPDINQGFVSDANRARQSIPPGNVARNMADTTAIKRGDVTGTPAPIISESMRTKALRVGNKSRDAVMGVAEQARDAGTFNVDVDQFRYSAKDMQAGAWNIYKTIINADSLAEVKNLFLTNRSVIKLGEGLLQKEYLNEEQFGGALAALKDLTDRYIGRGIMESSARVMDTLGRESADMAEAIRVAEGVVDENRVMDLILDKMEYLMQEVGLNKYIKGWQFHRLDDWYKTLAKSDDPAKVIKELHDEFGQIETNIATKWQKFTGELKELQKTNPLAIRPLAAAFERSAGDVDTLEKLMIWARDQVTPMGLIASPNPTQMNKFAQGLWAVGYNNILSGLSAARAVLGNTVGIISKPISAFSGGTLEGLLSGGNFRALKKSIYYFGGISETNRRMVKDSWKMMKKVWKDPDAMIDTMRRDLVQADTIDWDILDQTRDVWVSEGNWGRVMQLDFAKMNYDLSRWAPMRIGMTALQSADAGLNAVMGTYVSRVRAYDEVFSKLGKVDADSLAKAEKKHYNKLFDKNGKLTDNATKTVSGEIALNLQDDLSDQINKVVTRYPFLKTFFMFPRTLSNNLKLNLSWTPLASIPGLTKYGDTIWAETPEEIAKAMQRHGISMSDPNAMTIFENLRTEYKGRIAFSGMLVGGLWTHAMSGNVRGNGSQDPTQRRIDRDQFGFQEKTIKVGNVWVSYKGMPIVDPMLTILGDMAYYARDLEHTIVEDALDKLVWTTTATFLNESVMTGLEPFSAMLNQDISWLSRHTANTARIFLPMSGAAGVISKAIDSTQKDIHDNVLHYLQNRTPLLSMGLPKQIDIYTGEYLNDIDNPVLRIINALSPVKVSGTDEWWRQELRDTGYDGLSVLKRHSSGDYEYTPDEREYVNKLVGDQQIYKQIIKVLKKRGYQEQLQKLKAHRASGDDIDYTRVEIDGQRLPVFREIDRIVRNAQLIAEQQLVQERPDIWATVHDQQLIDQLMEAGRIDEARGVAEKNQQMVELLEMPK